MEVVLTRHKNNPIMMPTKHAWENKAVYNPGVTIYDGRILILYRAQGDDMISRFGLAFSDDGYHIAERLPEPVFEPDLDTEYEQLGVEDPRRDEADLGQAGEVLVGGVQDPLGVDDRLLDGGEVRQGDRVEQPRARPAAAQLDEVGLLPVAVAGGALGVDRDRAGAAAQRLGVVDQGGGGLDHRRQAVAGGEEGDRFGDVDLGGVDPGCAVVRSRGVVGLRPGRGLGAQLPSTFSPVSSSCRRPPGARAGVPRGTGKGMRRLSGRPPDWQYRC